MKRLILLCTILFLFVGCNSPKPEEGKSLKILAPKGSAGLSLLDYYDAIDSQAITLVDGTDLLSAELASAVSDYDVIIAPVNLGAKIAESGNSEYALLGIVTWGNLYLVQNDDLVNSEQPIVLFGEGAVPQKIVDSTLDFSNYSQEVIYLPSVTEAQSYLLSGKASYALLAEPALTATLAKAQENGIALSIASNLQKEWELKTGYSNYPQAAVFVKKSSYQEKRAEIDVLITSLEQMNAYASSAEGVEAKLTGHEEEFGVAKAAIIVKAWPGMNIKFVPAKDVMEEIKYFLDLFNISLNSNLFIE